MAVLFYCLVLGCIKLREALRPLAVQGDVTTASP